MLMIGADVGGTGIKSALIDVEKIEDPAGYRMIDQSSMPTQGRSGAKVICDNIVRSIRQFDIDACDYIGVASAGTIDWNTGDVVFATEVLQGFTGLKLGKELSSRLGRRVAVVNDAVAALVAEAYMGAAREYPSVLMFTLGTGLGASLMRSRDMNDGAFVDTRMGHVELHPEGRKCFCGKRGCAESYVSASGLRLSSGEDDLSVIFDSREERCRHAVDEFFSDFLRVLDLALERYDPAAIVVGGGVIELKSLWWDQFQARYYAKHTTPLIPARLGNKAGVMGAAFCAANGIFQQQ